MENTTFSQFMDLGGGDIHNFLGIGVNCTLVNSEIHMFKLVFAGSQEK